MTSDLRHCRASLANHSKSFALASRLLPGRMADEAAIVYSWCRRADDAVDSVSASDRRAALATLRGEIGAIYGGAPQSEPALRAFQQVVHDREIPREYPDELLNGMEMDIERDRYPCLDDLWFYCFRVAGTVGLMMCHVMGVRDRGAMRRAVHLGIAMQLTNICRDVIEDWEMRRLYLPEDMLAACGAPNLADRLGRAFPDEAAAPVARVVARLLHEADAYYQSGDVGLRALPWRSALAVRAARRIYAAIGQQIARRQCDVRAGRAVVPLRAKLRHVLGSALDAALDAPRRAVARRLSEDHDRSQPLVIRFPDDVLPMPGEARSEASFRAVRKLQLECPDSVVGSGFPGLSGAEGSRTTQAEPASAGAVGPRVGRLKGAPTTEEDSNTRFPESRTFRTARGEP